jgi:hypothetical protein
MYKLTTTKSLGNDSFCTWTMEYSDFDELLRAVRHVMKIMKQKCEFVVELME